MGAEGFNQGMVKIELVFIILSASYMLVHLFSTRYSKDYTFVKKGINSIKLSESERSR